MKNLFLHRLDFRSIIASLPVLIILAGFSAGTLTSGTDSRSAQERQKERNLISVGIDVETDSHNSQAESGMAGENQPATVPDTRWTASTFYFGKDQSRKDKSSGGPNHGLAGEKQNSILSQSCQTSLGNISSKLGRRFTLLGLKPSGTS